MKVRIGLLLLAAVAATPAPAQEAKSKTFFRDGGWSGEVQAIRRGGFDTPRAWAIGRRSKDMASEACSGREGPDRPRCVRQLIAEPEIRIFADCSAGVAWRQGDKARYALTVDAKSGKLKPLDDDAAWSMQMSHRAKWTVGSWLGFLCPASSKAWRLGEGSS